MEHPEDAKSTQNAAFLAKTSTAPQRKKIRFPLGFYSESQQKHVPTLGEKLKKDLLLARMGATILRKTI